MDGGADLKAVFKKCCKGKPDMDNRSFVKMFKDSKLVGKGLTTTDLDMTFAKVKAKGTRRITYT